MLFLLAAIVAALVALARRGPARQPGRVAQRMDALLDARWAPAAVGAAFGLAIWAAWGRLAPPPLFHDEIAYLLQAKLFAMGRWSAPSPPEPALFAQPHVLVEPVFASKYPPGHSLLLALGVLAGTPALVVVLLNAVRGALAYALARRLTDGRVALLTTLLLVNGDSVRFGASYFSEVTTGALLLVAFWALLRWRDAQERAAPAMRWIVLLAAALGWCAITRPFSAVCFALPMGVVVLRDVARTRRWRELGTAMAVGTAIVMILPLWSARTTGDWRLWPATRYTRDYMPFDHPHFGVDATAPRLPLPGDLARIVPSLRAEEARHTVDRLPEMAVERARFAARASWASPVVEGTMALVGALVAPAAALVGTATAVTLFAGYLAHPTWADWTIYYLEAAPVLAFLGACGIAALLGRIERGEPLVPAGTRIRGTAGLAVIFVAALIQAQRDVRYNRAVALDATRYQDQFRHAVRRIPAPAVLFVRHADWHSPHLSLIQNEADWRHAPLWVVADGGAARNAALLRAAPGRRAFVFDEARGQIGLYSAEPAPSPGPAAR